MDFTSDDTTTIASKSVEAISSVMTMDGRLAAISSLFDRVAKSGTMSKFYISM